MEVTLAATFQLYLVSVAGSLALWIKSDRSARRIHGLSDVYELIMPGKESRQYLLTFFTFLMFGGVVGMILIDPVTTPQAFAGGVAWSYLISSDRKDA